ncbi:hypothetical protein LTR66_005496 [Elasticomyces elasticus]|nr:hypothetical protein LTR66_005496 [Elasticomyces elasticus]
MSRKVSAEPELPVCAHTKLVVNPSPHAADAGYKRLTPGCFAASAVHSLTQGKKRKRTFGVPTEPETPAATTFPAPLVLPGDELSYDPEYPAQSLTEWISEEERNAVTPRRRTIYLAAPPQVAPDMSLMATWSKAQHAALLPEGSASKLDLGNWGLSPNTAEVLEYLAAFYHGLPVKLLQPGLEFAAWDGDSAHTHSSKSRFRHAPPTYVGLVASEECTRIRTRVSRDGLFARQLNLDDLLDAAISMLPKDAYALLLLVDQDIYENEDDDFACGRAYGGSRVAVISVARYNPQLDAIQSVERVHAWPASHCLNYVEHLCAVTAGTQRRGKAKKLATNSGGIANDESTAPLASRSALRQAVTAHNLLPSLETDTTPATLSGLWLGRVCRTASHELGHCLGIDHCVYYACSMQGTASLMEDGRQPPYLCPVDLAKVLQATGSSARERYQALLAYCDKRADVHLFAAFSAWLRVRQQELNGS